MNDSKAFGDYICKANNTLGELDRIITLLNGTKPSKPTVLQLRGVNSDTFDIDVGAMRPPGPRQPMEINGYRFEVISTEEFKANGGKWDRARVENLGFEDGEFNDFPNPSFLFVVLFASNLHILRCFQELHI